MDGTPRIVFFGNNQLAVRVASWLRARDAAIVAAVVHPSERQRYRDELLHELGLPPDAIFDASRLHEPDVIRGIAALQPDIGLSVLFGFILKTPVLELFPRGVINLHPALLPFNRGASPNIWSIVDETPAGATLHYVDAGVDTGDILAQREVVVDATDTGYSLYRKLEDASYELFINEWPNVVSGSVERRPQPAGGTVHRVKDREPLAEIDLDRTYTARELINVIRALTFPPYHGAWFRDGDRTVYMRLELTAEESANEQDN